VAAARPITPTQTTHAIATAERTRAVQLERARHPDVKPTVSRATDGSIEVTYLHDLDRGTAVTIGRDGRVAHVWTGYAAGWELARGHRGVIGGAVTEPWVLILFSLAFAIPFLDRRRLLSSRNMDLAALLFFGVPLLLFDHGHIAVAVALVYPPLIYLGVRMLALGRGRPSGFDLVTNVPMRLLAYAIPALCALRVVLDLTSRVQLDVATFSVLGADKLVHGQAIYGHMPTGGDHYGPLAYAAYAPAEALFPYTGQRDPAAAHLTGIAFDLFTVLALYLVGTRLGGRRLAVVLAYAWVASPLTAVALCTHANDGLVALLLVGLVAVIMQPALAGMVASAATLAKAAPFALVPLAALHPGVAVLRPRRLALFAAGFVLVAVVTLVPILRFTSPGDFVHATFLWESANHTPFSIWGLVDPTAKSYWVYLVESMVRAGALILALVVAVRPARRTVPEFCAFGAAILIALQLSANYWLFTYASWFVPLVLIAWLTPPSALSSARRPGPSTAAYRAAADRGRPAPAPAPAQRAS
jgi:hypothetical protein